MKSTTMLLSSMLLAATVSLAQAQTQTTPDMNRDSTGTPQAATEMTDTQAAKPAKKAKKAKRGTQADAAAHKKVTQDGAVAPKDLQPASTPAQ